MLLRLNPQALTRLLRADLDLSYSPWVVLWALGMAASWLNPNHYMPWVSFDADVLMASLGLAAALAMLVKSREWRVPLAAWLVLALAAVPAVQWVFGLIYFAGDAWVHAAFLLGLALAVATGAQIERQAPQAVLQAVLGGAAVAAMLSVGLQLHQWLDIGRLDEHSGLGVWVFRMPAGNRPLANLGQPNQLASLLLWGLIGLWNVYLRGWVRGWIVASAAAYVLLGIAMTQSRMAWLVLVVMLVFSWFYRTPLEVRRYRVGIALLAAWFVLLVLGWDEINRLLYFAPPETFEARLTGGSARLKNWPVVIEALRLRPWAGFGWGQVSVAQQSALLAHAASGEYFAYAHNLVLDLLVWNGLPLGVLATMGLGLWFIGRFRAAATPADVLQLLAVCSLTVHALLEYPHAYAYFLIPVGLLAGALSARTSSSALPRVKSVAVAPLVIVAGGLLVGIVIEYRQATETMQQSRYAAARIGKIPDRLAIPDFFLLTQLGDYLRYSQIDVRKPVDGASLELMRRVSERFPSTQSMFRYAMSASLGGYPDVADDVLRRLRWMHDEKVWESIRSAWIEEASRHPQMRSSAIIPSPAVADSTPIDPARPIGP